MDIELAIFFMCTRVSKSTHEDWEKLRKLLSYLQYTIDMPRIIGANDVDVLQTWVDVPYAIHYDLRGDIGGIISLGHGIVHDKFSQQKLNTKSSTGTEAVEASDYSRYTLYIKWILRDQGYNSRRKIFYQDNMSAMKMEKNSR